jgi:hypothetical protein
MGIAIPGTHANNYYSDASLYGDYQFLTLEEVVKTFMATYVGVGKICENIRSSDVSFHAGRALQEFNYDVFRSIKSQEITVPNTLQLILPRDFVNHVKLSYSDSAGVKHIIYPTRFVSNPLDIGQDANNDFTFTGNALDTDTSSETMANFKAATPNENQQDDYNDDDYKYMSDERYGIEPEHAQINGSYFIDYANGKIHFGSSLSGKTLVLDYISDGMNAADLGGVPSGSAIVHKFAEEAMYKHILYGCLSAQAQPHPMLAMIKKERFAETRKAKIRLSNIKIEELAQIMRGGSKWIKH